jgi:hypothetical protein
MDFVHIYFTIEVGGSRSYDSALKSVSSNINSFQLQEYETPLWSSWHNLKDNVKTHLRKVNCWAADRSGRAI